MPLGALGVTFSDGTGACTHGTHDCTSSATTLTNHTHVWCTWVTTVNDTASTAITTNVWPGWAASVHAGDLVVFANECTTGQVEPPNQAAIQAREEARLAAKAKARSVLDQHLSEEQRAQLARDQFFLVEGSAGRRYRIRQGRSNNIDRLDAQGQVAEHLCGHPQIACPDEDTMLGQKLALETDEEAFRKVANVRVGTAPPAQPYIPLPQPVVAAA